MIAFAAHHAVVLYDGNSQRVVGTLLGHADRVNCVRWLDKFTLISGAADGSLCLYRQQRKDCGTPAVSSWTVVARCPPAVPAAPITFIASTKWTHSLLEPEPSTDTNVHVLIITSGDGNISVWTVACAPELGSTSGPVELQRVDRLTVNNSSLPTCAAMMCGPSPRVTECKPYLLVAIGCVDGNVLLYTCHPPFSLKLACRLSGHTNWVRGVAFTSTRSRVSSDVSLLLATASQDRTVRLWRLVNRSSEKTTREVENRSLTRFAPKPHFSVNDVIQFEAQVEALLLGHEDWVHSVAWQPGKHESEDGDNLLETPTLLTTSMDRTMMLWVRDEATGTSAFFFFFLQVLYLFLNYKTKHRSKRNSLVCTLVSFVKSGAI